MSSRYQIDGRPVPSVTEIIRELFPCWQADEWHLQRGTAMHACCALIAQGKEFTFDPVLEGRITACRKWFAAFKPEVLEVEAARTITLHQFGGRPDLICRIAEHEYVVDWKSTLNKEVELQLGGYSILSRCQHGMAVELRDDGTYKIQAYDKRAMHLARNTFLACHVVYGIKQKWGMIEREESENNE